MEVNFGQFKFRPMRLGTVLGATAAYVNYKNNYDEGESVTSASSKALGHFAISQVVPWFGWGSATYFAAKGLSKTLTVGSNQLAMLTQNSLADFGQNYRDTVPAATMRQASKAVIANNQLNARYFMGNEARLMNRG